MGVEAGSGSVPEYVTAAICCFVIMDGRVIRECSRPIEMMIAFWIEARSQGDIQGQSQGLEDFRLCVPSLHASLEMDGRGAADDGREMLCRLSLLKGGRHRDSQWWWCRLAMACWRSGKRRAGGSRNTKNRENTENTVYTRCWNVDSIHPLI